MHEIKGFSRLPPMAHKEDSVVNRIGTKFHYSLHTTKCFLFLTFYVLLQFCFTSLQAKSFFLVFFMNARIFKCAPSSFRTNKNHSSWIGEYVFDYMSPFPSLNITRRLKYTWESNPRYMTCVNVNIFCFCKNLSIKILLANAR